MEIKKDLYFILQGTNRRQFEYKDPKSRLNLKSSGELSLLNKTCYLQIGWVRLEVGLIWLGRITIS
jgi:hypothetical protein